MKNRNLNQKELIAVGKFADKPIEGLIEKRMYFLMGIVVPLDFRFGAIQTGVISFSTGEIFISLLCFYFLMGARSLRVSPVPIFGRDMIFPVLYLCWTVLSSFIFQSLDNIQIARNIAFLGVLYYLIVRFCSDEERLRLVILGFVFGVLVNSFLGISQYLFDWPRFFDASAHGADAKESIEGLELFQNPVTGIFGHPNLLGLHLSLAITIMTTYALNIKNNLTKTQIFIVCVFLGFVTYLTQSKGAIIWCLFGIAFGVLVSMLSAKNNVRFFALFMPALLIYVIIEIVVPYMAEAGNAGTVMTRIILAKVFFEVVTSDVIGMIFGGNQDAIFNMSGFFSSFEYANAHNFYLNQVVYFGLIGFCLFLFFLLNSIFRISASLEVSGKKASNVALLTGLVILIGFAYFEPIHREIGALGSFYLICALCVSSSKLVLGRPCG